MAEMAEIASYMNNYSMRGQHSADRSMTRYKHDNGKMIENNEISTGPGRWALGVPNAYGNAAFVATPTTINQRWGAAHDMTSTKTDVESDLKNLGRPTVRTTCGQYQPEQGQAVAQRLTAMPEADFPQTASHLVDPPCTLRGTGINRWQWLCENPQENVMVPFEYLVDSRHAAKDSVYTAMDKPLESSKAVQERQFRCGQVFMEPAVPVARPRGPKDPQNFSDTVPGAPQKPQQTPPAARFNPTGAAKQGSGYSGALGAPPLGPPTAGERERAATGILAPPPPFSAFIAPH
jgi:hypothetical protein